MIIAGGQIGAVVKNGKGIKQYQQVNTDLLEYCWRHNLDLTSDWRNPSLKDKKKLDKIRLVVYERIEKGRMIKSRYCKKCFQDVPFTKPI